jgi:hypothetical protein
MPALLGGFGKNKNTNFYNFSIFCRPGYVLAEEEAVEENAALACKEII